MFFFFSKIFWFLINPLVWVVTGLCYGFWAKPSKKTKAILGTSLILLLFFSNPMFSNYALKQWEWQPVEKAELPFCDVGIVLTGMTHSDYQPSDQIHFSESADRITEALILFNEGLVSQVLVTGGIATIKANGIPESEALLPLLNTTKLAKSNLLLEKQARNTYENAVLSTELLTEHELQDRRALLITSAFHMNRAMACFRKQGLDVIAYPVDYRSSEVDLDIKWLLPSPTALQDWHVLFKEWIGYMMYKLVGYA